MQHVPLAKTRDTPQAPGRDTGSEGHLNPSDSEKRFEPRNEIPREVTSRTDPELSRYRIVAQRTDPEHPGASVVTNYAYGRSVEETAAKARKALEKPTGLHGDQGMYRVEDARRRYLTTILEYVTYHPARP